MSRPLIIPVFLSQRGCRHRCIFCNQEGITGIPPSSIGREDLQRLVKRHLKHVPKGRYDHTQLAFYGGDFCGLPSGERRRLLEISRELIEQGFIDSLRVSTRPDTLARYGVTQLRSNGVRTIEIGAQSMVDDVLARSRRGHGSQEIRVATAMAKSEGLEVGIHLMIGLPGDDEEGILFSAEEIVGLRPDFVRLHPVLVIAGTPLADLYRQGLYRPIGMNETIELCKRLMLMFAKAGIPVIRIGLQPNPHLQTPGRILAGPFHPALRHMIESEIFLEMARRLLEGTAETGRVKFAVSPRDISSFKGLRKRNLHLLKKSFPRIEHIEVNPDPLIAQGTLQIRESASVRTIEMKGLAS